MLPETLLQALLRLPQRAQGALQLGSHASIALMGESA